MKNTLLAFRSLPELAQFIKLAEPASYLIDTTTLIVLAPLSDLEIAIAIEQFRAVKKTSSRV